MALGSDYNYSLCYDYEMNYDEVKPAIHLILSVYMILIICISVSGNSFLLWVLLKERAWKTTSDILLLQLIMSDLCFTLTSPFLVCDLLLGRFWAMRVMNFFFVLGLNSYVLILTTMTLYCYVAVVHASRLSAQATQKFRYQIHIPVIWLVCAAAGIKESLSFPMQLFDLYMQIGLFFLVPLIINTFCSVHMWITIKQCMINRHHQASRLILLMIVVFFLSLAPYNITIFIHSLIEVDILEITNELIEALNYFNALVFLHCCLNPLLHIFGAQRFRRHLPVKCSTSSQRSDGSQNLSAMTVIPPFDASV